jgi:hypothetical protein
MPRRWRGLLRCRNWLSRQVLTCAIQFIKPPAPGNLVRGQDDHFANSIADQNRTPKRVTRVVHDSWPFPPSTSLAPAYPPWRWTCSTRPTRAIVRLAAGCPTRLIRRCADHGGPGGDSRSTTEIAPFRRRRWPHRGNGLAAIRGGKVHTLMDVAQVRRAVGHLDERADGGRAGD